MQAMKQPANIIYLLIGIIFPILIGVLHTIVHFQDLTTPEVRAVLSESIIIMSEEQILWNTWGLMSFMMGISFIIIGLLNINLILKNGWHNYPSVLGILIMLIYLTCVIYISYTFQVLPQFYGGLFGLLLGFICLFITIFHKQKNSTNRLN